MSHSRNVARVDHKVREKKNTCRKPSFTADYFQLATNENKKIAVRTSERTSHSTQNNIIKPQVHDADSKMGIIDWEKPLSNENILGKDNRSLLTIVNPNEHPLHEEAECKQ